MENDFRKLDKGIVTVNTVSRVFNVIACVLSAIAGVIAIVKGIKKIRLINSGEDYVVED